MLYLTGIHQPSQLARFDAATFLGRRRRIAVDLIDAIDATSNASARQAMFEQIVDARMVFKRTYPDRFADFDAALIEQCCQHLSGARPLEVLDAAVSDGSTSLPLLERIDRLAGGNFEFVATDLDGRYLKVWRRGDERRRVILSDRGEIVQIVCPPFVFGHRGSRYLFPVNSLLKRSAERFARALLADRDRHDPGIATAEILLLQPDFRARIARDSRVRFRAWDILEPWQGQPAHCVRAMNTMNPGYFDETGLARILANLFDATAEGGLIAVGSNENPGSPVDGVICRRTGSQLAVLASFGTGFRAVAALAPFVAPSVA
jgi:chemotaxis methyl-accepting protein methylase